MITKEFNLEELPFYNQPDVAFNIVKGNIHFSVPCVYFLYEKGELVYIGKTKCLSQRVSSHYSSKIFKCDQVRFVRIFTETERKLIEQQNILKYLPRGNKLFLNHTEKLSIQAELEHKEYLDKIEEFSKDFMLQTESMIREGFNLKQLFALVKKFTISLYEYSENASKFDRMRIVVNDILPMQVFKGIAIIGK